MKRSYELRKLKSLKKTRKNPRKISKAQKLRLEKSLEEFPEMLKVSSIVVDEDNEVLIGNQRVQALIDIGKEELEVMVVSGFTEEQKSELMLKDNSHYGEFDMDALFDAYNESDIINAGLSYKPIDEVVEDSFFVSNDEAKMPIVPEFDEKHDCVVIVSDNETDTSFILNFLGITKMKARKKEETGKGYIISAKDFQKKLNLGELEYDEI